MNRNNKPRCLQPQIKHVYSVDKKSIQYTNITFTLCLKMFTSTMTVLIRNIQKYTKILEALYIKKFNFTINRQMLANRSASFTINIFD